MNHKSAAETMLMRLRSRALERRLVERPAAGGRWMQNGRVILNFSSNDYLGLAQHPDVLARAHAALDRYGAGAGASRLAGGTLPIHSELEQRLSSLKRQLAALVFGSGYLASLGAIAAPFGRDDVIWADRLVHASLLDAIALSRARLIRFRHNDVDHLATLLSRTTASGQRLIVTESVFSMDGDLAPLGDIAALAERYEAMLLVDEAHATGIFGPGGAGRMEEEGLKHSALLAMGTLSKALGSVGGFLASSVPMRDLLLQRARSFIYTTALPPSAAGAALGALDVLARDPNLGTELLRRAAWFRERLHSAGLNTLHSASQIVPVLVGENQQALSLSARLEKEGILATSIRPPTVPAGTARLRLSVSLAHSEGDLEFATDRIIAAARAEGIV